MRKVIARKSKKAVTLVELIVSMALMSIFVLACAALIFPVTNIYSHMNKKSRAQLVADTVVDSLRAECARSYITSKNDVWISNEYGNAVLESVPIDVSGPGQVLVLRKNYEYCETLSSNYAITGELCNAIYDAENTDETDPLTGDSTSRAIYNMFSSIPAASEEEASPIGYLHFGYFNAGSDLSNASYPSELYDFTDPFMAPTYGEFTVGFEFHDIKYDSTDTKPVYVLVNVYVYDGAEIVYTRSDVVLSFASKVME